MENKDLKLRTRQFALRVITLFSTLPKTVEAQIIASSWFAPAHRLGLTIEKLNTRSPTPTS